MIIENELSLLFLIEIHTNLQKICTAEKHGKSTSDLIFSSVFLNSIRLALIYIWKYSKLTSVWFLLIWKVPEFRKKTYWFSELIILFLKVGALRILKINIRFCPKKGPKITILSMLGASESMHWVLLHEWRTCPDLAKKLLLITTLWMSKPQPNLIIQPVQIYQTESQDKNGTASLQWHNFLRINKMNNIFITLSVSNIINRS